MQRTWQINPLETNIFRNHKTMHLDVLFFEYLFPVRKCPTSFRFLGLRSSHVAHTLVLHGRNDISCADEFGTLQIQVG